MHTDHSALRYLMAKKDDKPRLIKWVVFLQDDAMSELGEKAKIGDVFPDKHALVASQDLI